MCDFAMTERFLELERRLNEHLLECQHPDAFPHVHEGYVTREHVRSHVDTCLTEAAIAAEAELPPPKPQPEPKVEPKAEPPKPAPAPAPPLPKEPGPTGQGTPDRRHALHRRIGGPTIGRRA